MSIHLLIHPSKPLIGPDPTTITLRPLNAPLAVTFFKILDEAHEWNVHDIRIAKRGQLAQPGELPGDLFSAPAVIDQFVKLDVCPEGQTIEIDVRYAGQGTGVFKAVIGGSVTLQDAAIDPPDLMLSVEIPGEDTVIVAGAPLRVGSKVRVIDGPFERFTGTVMEVNHAARKVKVTFSIMGRETSTEFDFSLVEKAGEHGHRL